MCQTLFSLAAENLQIRRSNPSYDWVIKILYKQFDDLGSKGKALVITHYLQKGRMIVSSFLTKDLLIDWRKGERYFANMLVDYNMSANNGGWQWASGSGTDAQPYFRIFNPWLQSKKYDPNCEYIKKYIPELQDVDDKHIHHWYKHYKDYDVNYPKPMIDHSEARKEALKVFKKYL